MHDVPVHTLFGGRRIGSQYSKEFDINIRMESLLCFFSLHPPILKKHRQEKTMKYEQKVANLERHLKEHPTDYQAVVAHLVARSDAIEHRAWLRMIERKKRLAEIRRMRKERQNAEEQQQQ